MVASDASLASTLQTAVRLRTDLTGAFLDGVKLTGADLTGAFLDGVIGL